MWRNLRRPVDPEPLANSVRWCLASVTHGEGDGGRHGEVERKVTKTVYDGMVKGLSLALLRGGAKVYED